MKRNEWMGIKTKIKDVREEVAQLKWKQTLGI